MTEIRMYNVEPEGDMPPLVWEWQKMPFGWVVVTSTISIEDRDDDDVSVSVITTAAKTQVERVSVWYDEED